MSSQILDSNWELINYPILLPKGTVFNNIKALGVNSVALVGQLKKEETYEDGELIDSKEY